MGLFSKKKKDITKNENGFIDIEIKELIQWNEPNGNGCIVSDRITKDGYKVGYMYRENPDDGVPDSGWRFLAGNEDDAYMNDAGNHHILSINEICNYDCDIIPYLNSPINSTYIRVDSIKFEMDDGSKPIFIDKQ